MRFRVPCPAKLNLSLAVGPKDACGLHQVRTVLQAVSLFDELEIDTNAQVPEIECDWPDLPAATSLTKTLSLAAEALRLPSLGIRLTKRIPPESGLGGGSSDAAGLLRFLVAQFGLDPDLARGIAKAIGVDTAFFLIGGKALGDGYGERLTPLPDAPPRWAVVARPDEGCPTAPAYARLDSAPPRPWPPNAPTEGHNDFEAVAPEASLRLLDTLRGAGASPAGLTGSGSAVYGFLSSEREATEMKASIDPIAPHRCWLVRTLDRAECLAIERLDP
ncbi:MAG: hypothetical protein HY248_05320 [Fimbriimonas ginsengisoli]|uniref:4-diphosphocytidyl-2-C-methyl-D-erythritol kinase n=1 Tax=Fimbriimonas ginsengisoli TaxID=1005039 RepID=A0A931LWC5_FIMGI|nr:hypothetical protein [Fimbriimonas ginsengisoli]MBI3721955.1 hypothetical protein [Fimbriimonas ginsengisoli]